MFGILELFDRVLFLFWRRVRDFVREDCVYFVMILLDKQCFFSFFLENLELRIDDIDKMLFENGENYF